MSDRGGPKSRNREVPGSDPQSTNAQSAQSFAIGAREARWIVHWRGLSPRVQGCLLVECQTLRL
eukprot:2408221-Alexandrium_andersonii.AAC.1